MERSFWQGRRVLLTGHTGFKGGWLALWLERLGARVTGYALAPPSTPNLFTAARVAEGMAGSVVADLAAAEQLAATVARVRPEVVVHMAAQALVRRGYAAPVETFATNLMGTVNLLEAVRRTDSVRAVVVVTTDKVYENREWHWPYRESDRLGGHDPYAASKACAEVATAAYRRSFLAAAGVAVATARSGNVLGGGDWAEDRLVPDVLTALAAGRAPEIRAPEAIRPWQHVLEPLAGYLMLAERLWHDGASAASATLPPEWNFGPADEDARPVRWLVDRLARLWGGAASAGFTAQDGPRPHEAAWLKLDASRARHLLGWAPRLPLAEALAWTVEWQQAFLAKQDVRALTLAQIERYEAMGAGGA